MSFILHGRTHFKILYVTQAHDYKKNANEIHQPGSPRCPLIPMSPFGPGTPLSPREKFYELMYVFMVCTASLADFEVRRTMITNSRLLIICKQQTLVITHLFPSGIAYIFNVCGFNAFFYDRTV